MAGVTTQEAWHKRKIIANIFADTAKYSLTAGVIGSIVAGNFSTVIAALLGCAALIMAILAYLVTPEDTRVEG